MNVVGSSESLKPLKTRFESSTMAVRILANFGVEDVATVIAVGVGVKDR
jgi:hypothetical protein